MAAEGLWAAALLSAAQPFVTLEALRARRRGRSAVLLTATDTFAVGGGDETALQRGSFGGVSRFFLR